MDVFKPPLLASNRLYPCPFSISSDPNIYMTPGCLVHNDGLFYDPCRCDACAASKPLFQNFIKACQIAFDPRTMLIDDIPLGGWQVSPLEGLKEDVLLSVREAGNVVPGGDWTSDEGFLNVTGQFCDLMVDWWPEDQTLPLGYHATMPCMSNDTGYRTFDSAFAVERVASGKFTLVRLVYQHDNTRDATVIDSHYGAGGVCRGSNVGLPMFSVNTMQICTQAVDSPVDIAIPGQPAASALGQQQCSPDSMMPVWFDPSSARQDSSLHSVGTVPNMPTGTSYPEKNIFSIGPQAAIYAEEGFGASCAELVGRSCASSSECGVFICIRGVCVSPEFSQGTRCLSHEMCPNDMMCDGMGRCAHGEVVYLNEVPDAMEAVVFAEQCDEATSTPFYTDGASPWEYVPDWLEGHGMCSNKNWYSYNMNLQGMQQCASCQEQSCALNSRCNGWWPILSTEPKRFAVRPTLCDRDYEHLLGPSGLRMSGCTPNSAIVTDSNGGLSQLNYAPLFRNYDSSGTTQIARMPFRQYNKTGFLGQPQEALSSATILNCESVQNCYPYPFTVNNAPAQRLIPVGLRDQKSVSYVSDDTFRCGVFAVYSAQLAKCILDQSVLPLYRALCKYKTRCTCDAFKTDSIGCKPSVNQGMVLSICNNVQEQFTASYTTIRSNTKALQDLFSVFIQPDGSLASHVSGIECFQDIFQAMQMPAYKTQIYGLYYPFSFALLDVPLAWVYQCTFLGGIAISPQAVSIQCNQYQSSKNVSDPTLINLATNSIDFTLVRGGYTRKSILDNIQAMQDRIAAALPPISSIPSFKAACNSLGLNECDMVSYCASQRDWAPGKMDKNDRKMLASLYTSVCSDSKRDSLLRIMKMTFEDFINQKTEFHNYTLDTTTDPRLPTVMDIMIQSLQGCAMQDYDPSQRWPFLLSFPGTLDAITTCLFNNFFQIYRQLPMQLIQMGHPFADVDRAYAPSTNINMQYAGSPKRLKDPKDCVFLTLNEEQAYDDLPLTDECIWTDTYCPGKGQCKLYPKTYMYGTQNCSYPAVNAYTSLSSLVHQTWNRMADYFYSNWQSMPPFSVVQPGPLPFFSSPYDAWTYDTSSIRSYLSNINPDTSKEVMCNVITANATVNFTQCNDANYDVLQRFTASLRQRGAPVVPGKFFFEEREGKKT